VWPELRVGKVMCWVRVKVSKRSKSHQWKEGAGRRTAGRESGWSQVSVRQRISIFWSWIMCLSISGLLNKWVMEEADLILNVDSFKVGCTAETRPGFTSTSSARSKRQMVSREDVLQWMQRFWRINDLGLKMKISQSRDWHTHGGGMRGSCESWCE